jgi:hypothetical protein
MQFNCLFLYVAGIFAGVFTIFCEAAVQARPNRWPPLRPLNPCRFTVDAFDKLNHTLIKVVFFLIAGAIIVLLAIVLLFFSFLPR